MFLLPSVHSEKNKKKETWRNPRSSGRKMESVPKLLRNEHYRWPNIKIRWKGSSTGIQYQWLQTSPGREGNHHYSRKIKNKSMFFMRRANHLQLVPYGQKVKLLYSTIDNNKILIRNTSVYNNTNGLGQYSMTRQWIMKC